MKGQATFSTKGDCERSSGNIYADLEFDDANAMHTNAQLVTGMNEILKARGVTQQRGTSCWDFPVTAIPHTPRPFPSNI